jgi:single-stranded-DNA-specific exonuclease
MEAANLCKERGIDLIITDHHTPSKTLPDAYAVVNPKKEACAFPYPEICGAQVAWFLVGALKKRLNVSLDMGAFLDILALAIVADVMPLTAINRTLVQKGLEKMASSKRPAFEAVRQRLRKNRFGSEDVGFAIAPRINSAGRMADASIALRFLRAKSVPEALRLWDELDALNAERKEVESRIAEEAAEMVNPRDPVIVAAGENWHEGVVGIVASRLVGRFGKPAVVLSVENGRAKGSGRSVGSVDLFELVAGCREHLSGFGGHKMAVGLALASDRIAAFREALCKQASRLDPMLYKPDLGILGELPLSEIDWELMEILQRYEPYGEANGKPKFLIKNISVIDANPIGSE